MIGAYAFCPRCGSRLEELVSRWQYQCMNVQCHHMIYNNPTPVVAVVAHADGEVLLAHNRSWPGAFLAPITGFIEMNESAQEAAIREFTEELGATLLNPRIIGTYPFRRQNELIVAYSGTFAGEIVLGEELDRFEMVPFEQVRTWSFGTGIALRDFLGQVS